MLCSLNLNGIVLCSLCVSLIGVRNEVVDPVTWSLSRGPTSSLLGIFDLDDFNLFSSSSSLHPLSIVTFSTSTIAQPTECNASNACIPVYFHFPIQARLQPPSH